MGICQAKLKPSLTQTQRIQESIVWTQQARTQQLMSSRRGILVSQLIRHEFFVTPDKWLQYEKPLRLITSRLCCEQVSASGHGIKSCYPQRLTCSQCSRLGCHAWWHQHHSHYLANLSSRSVVWRGTYKPLQLLKQSMHWVKASCNCMQPILSSSCA